MQNALICFYLFTCWSDFCVPLSSDTKSLVEIRGPQGRDLTIPCYAPPYLNNPFLQWSFSNGEDPSRILTYDIQSGHSTSSPPWDNHVELDGFRVPFGDGSLRLMDPRPTEHTGSYTCVFSVPYNTHTEHTDVTIEDPVGEVTNTNPVRDQRGPCANWFTEATGPDKYNHVLVRLSTLLNFLSVALS